ncbi:putative pyridoxal kinase BUD17 KNAG_0D00430 [Huiozyma naganishii CBS 8797]|uniref:pyridoxal kinase n=1 Tax=Huiozyma naganishii (strain ATCC MYA-139 / BCRC 22969 / CBS 8797 / KCTC 17520 / NBRC 10181 / NCYC 3082 / Yp74L-3) TaxID=1071383 RepID=J7S6J3_HUIN7|nr:hypothetical protein KNAG_0D00430 [Kazachstania naganishii CBS 8797]CCK69796.1 hypothetical protein KNAG_0D00430 [Kazachstania naganishii CBS 8797]
MKALLIQSHVVHGYVGNKASSFPLQLRGWDVDALNTVQYSNHPGYGFFSGFQYSEKVLRDTLLKGLIESMDIHYDVVLTGYCPSGEILEEMARIINSKMAHVKWVLDPVLGDNNRLYVSETVVDVYRTLLRDNLVYLTTPNQFEMELLTGTKIRDAPSLHESLRRFHKLYPRVQRIVVTSIDMDTCGGDPRDTNYVVGYWGPDFTVDPSSHTIKKINALFNGSGDLFTALLMDYSVAREMHLGDAVTATATLTSQILSRTCDLTPNRAQATDPDVLVAGPAPVKVQDLKLIQCRDLIVLPAADPPADPVTTTTTTTITT